MEQKYLVRIKSDVREAEFDVTGENGVCTSVRLKSLRYLKANPNSGHGEVMDAHIYENDDSPMNSNMLYKWIVLWGSIPEVIKEVETNLPVVMLETNVVWDGFEEDEGKSEICYTYPFSTHGVANTQSTQFPRCCSAAKVKWSQKCSIKIWKMSVSSFPNSAERMRSCEAKKSACQKPRYTVE